MVTRFDKFLRNLGRYDSTAIRFYLGNELRQQELGYLTFGAQASPLAIIIPPKADQFIIESYCPAIATNVCTF